VKTKWDACWPCDRFIIFYFYFYYYTHTQVSEDQVGRVLAVRPFYYYIFIFILIYTHRAVKTKWDACWPCDRFMYQLIEYEKELNAPPIQVRVCVCRERERERERGSGGD